MGLSGISAALQTDLDLLIILYDNESAANTDIQATGMTTYGAQTTFTPGAGFAYHFGPHFALVGEVRTLAALPSFVAVVDFNTGVENIPLSFRTTSNMPKDGGFGVVNEDPADRRKQVPGSVATGACL